MTSALERYNVANMNQLFGETKSQQYWYGWLF